MNVVVKVTLVSKDIQDGFRGDDADFQNIMTVKTDLRTIGGSYIANSGAIKIYTAKEK